MSKSRGQSQMIKLKREGKHNSCPPAYKKKQRK